MERFETFSTTADVGIRIQGTSFAELYGAAFKGLLLLLFNELPDFPKTPELAAPPQSYPYEFQGDSCENILVNLLAEVLYLLQNQDRLTIAVDIHEGEETYINADIVTIPLDREPLLEIKSVTYHNLSVQENNGIKSASIVFDI